MIRKVHHVAIAVKNLDEAIKLFDSMFGVKPAKIETVSDQGVKAALIPMAEGGEIELIEPIDPNSGVAKFLEKKGRGIHHIAYEVDNVNNQIKDMQEKGVIMLDKEPRHGANNTKIAFAHPKSLSGVLTEFTEKEK